MDSEKSSLNPSSLLDLKAELHKKYESFQRAKLSQSSEPRQATSFKYKGQKVVKDKSTTPKVTLISEDPNEEELALKKSQLALEAKARIYEKITSNNILIDDEENEKYLVDFHRKVLYDTPVPNKIENIKSQPLSSEETKESSQSFDMFKDIYDKQSVSNKQSDTKLDESHADQPVHYQNVQFNEVRDHGVGYFAFSMDESKRKEQMEELNELRQQTEKQRVSAQRMQRKRKAMLEARLAKVCERRNIDKSVLQTYTKSQDNADEIVQEEAVDLSAIPFPETQEVQEKKEVKIRPWDVGKSDFIQFVPEKRKPKTQNEWVKDRRSERPSDFAPPSSYR